MNEIGLFLTYVVFFSYEKRIIKWVFEKLFESSAIIWSFLLTLTYYQSEQPNMDFYLTSKVHIRLCKSVIGLQICIHVLYKILFRFLMKNLAILLLIKSLQNCNSSSKELVFILLYR